MTVRESVPDELLGLRLYGENLDDAAITAWFEDESQGYFELDPGSAASGDVPGSGEVTRYHVLRHLPASRFACCLALGAASGREYEAFRGRVDRFIAIEPGRGFWRDSIAGAPAEYRLPAMRGKIDLPDGACDVAGSFGVLHHIPNVGEVLAELARVLAPGAPLIIREPIVSLGDFRKPRPCLTRNERGIPHAMMDAMLDQAGFDVACKSFLRFPRLNETLVRLGISDPWDSPIAVRIDAAVSRLMGWNVRYWRPRLWHKAAPNTAYWLAIRR